MINFKEITKENLFSIIFLSVFEHQKDQVASNSVSIAEGHYDETAWFRGIFKDDVAVGFVMLEFDNKNKEYGVWRFMIDKNHQGKGYGKASMDLIKKVIKEKVPDIKEIYLSYVPKEKGGADEFYKKVGFEDTGKISDGEKVMCFKY
ncbi:MAG: GNAT family N-acetyltransferase [Chitinophagales bacterium]